MRLSKSTKSLENSLNTNTFFHCSLRRISNLSPLAKLKVQFCEKLIEGKSSMLQGLGNIVNCNEVLKRLSVHLVYFQMYFCPRFTLGWGSGSCGTSETENTDTSGGGPGQSRGGGDQTLSSPR